ncbi:glycosyltransferase family 2 protein, partial [Candidatus Roizmanbacteria bacterium]|nr:glycosyltransferase family 2 protein [Candidatus Roizmanbacteria bacterium]
MKTISYSIACFNEELNILPTYHALKKIALQYKGKYEFQYVFSDNCSIDKSQVLIKGLARKDKKVIGVFLSRNFGHEANGQAAIDYTTGDAVIPIECDLQDPPEVIPKFIRRWEEGYDVIVGLRTKLEDNFLMNIARKTFYKIFKLISNIEVPVDSGAFSLMDRKVVHNIKKLPEKYRFFRGLRAYVGFKTAYVKYHRRKRRFGKSSYNLLAYIKHSERGVFGFSYLLLDMIIYAGFSLVVFSFAFIIVYLLTVIIFGNPINASIPIMLTIFFFGGVQLLAISIIGKYIQVIVEETKERPL